MIKRVSCLLAVMAATVLSLTQTGLGVDCSFNAEEYPSYAVLSYVFQSNAGYEWCKNFTCWPGAANDWLVSNINVGAASYYRRLITFPDGGFGAHHEQACMVTVAFIPWRNVIAAPLIEPECRRTGNGGIPFMDVWRMRRRGFSVPLDLAVRCRCLARDGLVMTFRAGCRCSHGFGCEGAAGAVRHGGMSRTDAIRGRRRGVESSSVNRGAMFDFRDRREFGADCRCKGWGCRGYAGTAVFKF